MTIRSTLAPNANSGTVKRMKNNPHVRVTPSDALGKPHGVTIEGTAKRAGGDTEIEIIQASLSQIWPDEDVLRPVGSHQAA